MKPIGQFTLMYALLAASLLASAGEADFAKGYAENSSVYTAPHHTAVSPANPHHSATREKHSVGDGSITAAIKTKLLASSDTSGSRIHVVTKNGVVTLSGTARSKHEKIRAVQIARSVHGVRNIRNRLTVHA